MTDDMETRNGAGLGAEGAAIHGSGSVTGWVDLVHGTGGDGAHTSFRYLLSDDAGNRTGTVADMFSTWHLLPPGSPDRDDGYAILGVMARDLYEHGWDDASFRPVGDDGLSWSVKAAELLTLSAYSGGVHHNTRLTAMEAEAWRDGSLGVFDLSRIARDRCDAADGMMVSLRRGPEIQLPDEDHGTLLHWFFVGQEEKSPVPALARSLEEREAEEDAGVDGVDVFMDCWRQEPPAMTR